MSHSPSCSPESKPMSPLTGDPRYRCGTLQYTKASLFILFSWLLWGDFVFQLFESYGGPGSLKLYLQDGYHTSSTAIMIMFTTIPKAMGLVMTPLISVHSDRCRSPYGRRIPYIIFTAPFLCLFAVGLGFCDEIMEFFKVFIGPNAAAMISSVFSVDPANAPYLVGLFTIGALVIGYTFFNEFVGTIFWYLFADVVPRDFLGRFNALFKMTSTFAGFVAANTIYQYKLTHIRDIHIGMAILYFVGFGLLCWHVKEGKYPPVKEVTAKTPFREKVKLYFRECYTHPVYLFFYAIVGFNMLATGFAIPDIFTLHVSQYKTGVVADQGKVSAVLALPDGKRYLSGGDDGLVKLWTWGENGKFSKEPRLFQPPTGTADGPALTLAATADGSRVLTGYKNGMLRAWDVETGQIQWSIETQHGPVRCLALSGDDTKLASVGDDKRVYLWDVRTGALLQTLAGHEGVVRSAAFSSKGNLLVTGGEDHKIILWNTQTGEQVRVLGKHPGPVYAVCFAPVLEKVEREEDRNVARIAWDFMAGYFVEVFTNESLYDKNPDEGSRLLQEDGWIIAGGRDGETDMMKSMLHIWNVETGCLVREFVGHRKAITSVLFRSDVRMMLSAGMDSCIRLWVPPMPTKEDFKKLAEGKKLGDDTLTNANDESLKAISGYTRAVSCLSTTNKGVLVINASDNGKTKNKAGEEVAKPGTIHLWDLDQGISLRKMGICTGFFSILSMLIMYPLGMLVDRFNPFRVSLVVALPSIFIMAISYFLLDDYVSNVYLGLARMPLLTMAGLASIPMMILLFPPAKYGQFCSANALVSQSVAMVFGLAGGYLVDSLTADSLETDGFRYCYLLCSVTSTLAFLALCGVYYQWKKLGGDNYVPPEIAAK